MANKYYYDCPIQAAYMAKHHGMTFHGWRWNDEEFHFESTIHPDDEDDGSPVDFDGKKVFLTPESVALLVLDGDLMASSCDYTATLRVGEGIALDEAKEWVASGRGFVWRRNRLPFIAPKQEGGAA